MKASVEISDWIFNCDITHQATCGNCGHRVDFLNVTPHCPICGARMLNFVDVPCSSYYIKDNQPICYASKEECKCGGDKRVCEFYE